MNACTHGVRCLFRVVAVINGQPACLEHARAALDDAVTLHLELHLTPLPALQEIPA